jgi:hypothetical protein
MKDPPLVEQEGHLFASFVELALRPALHRPRARHWLRPVLMCSSNAGLPSRGREVLRLAGEDVAVQ